LSEKSYWKNGYKTEFNAKVIKIDNEGVKLDKTYFYPESGNQASDRGYLTFENFKFNVDKVSKDGDNILHHISSKFKNKLKVGDKINGTIDWDYRYGIMKAHTSQHIFSAVVKNKFNIDTTRANLDYEDVFLQISKKISYKQLKEILTEVNTICTSKNLKVNANIVSKQKAKKISEKIRSEIPDEVNIRLMEIEGLDLVCCGGTHVKNTSEIGKIFLYEFKKGKEIRYYVGNKAVMINSKYNLDFISLANKLNSPLEKTKDLLEKRLDFLEDIQEQQKNLSIKFLESISKLPTKTLNNISLFYIDFDIDIKLLNKMLDKFPLNSIIILKFDKNKIRILSLNEKIDSNKIIQILIKKFGGKGGGNPQSSQGFLKKMPENILLEIESLLKIH
jgi:Ser-tRNA(Ala) deacylase AlaX